MFCFPPETNYQAQGCLNPAKRAEGSASENESAVAEQTKDYMRNVVQKNA